MALRWLLQSNGSKMVHKLAWHFNNVGRSFEHCELTDAQALRQTLERLPGDDGVVWLCYGSVGFAKLLRQITDEGISWRAHVPCFFEPAAFEATVWQRECEEVLLNPKVYVYSIEQLQQMVDDVLPLPEGVEFPFFVRPLSEQKTFNGQLMQKRPAYTLAQASKVPKGLDPQLLCAVSKAQTISDEVRVVVANHQVIGLSYYRQGGKFKVQKVDDAGVIAHAQRLAAGWMPQEVCVMDMALHENGNWYIIEFNGIHGSGLYDMDLEQLHWNLDENML